MYFLHSSSIFFVILTVLFKFSNTVKWWIENPEFQNSGNWQNGKTPCSTDKIVFPEEFAAAIYTPVDLKTNGIFFPKTGAILLHLNSNISFTTTVNNDNDDKSIKREKCLNKNHLAIIKKPKTRNWFNPSNWKEFPGVEQNPATPHIERIPCSNEKVVIGLNGALSIDLDYVDELCIGGLYMGKKDLTSEQLESFFRTNVGQSIFKEAEDTSVKYSIEPICSCHNTENVMKYLWKVCKYARNQCEIPKCHNPIVPTGHCCAICGSSVKLHVKNCSDFNMILFKKQLRKILEDEEKLSNDVLIDYRIVSDGGDEFLQIVILDKNDYNQRSVALLNLLKDTLLKYQDYQDNKRTFHISGSPFSSGHTSTNGWIFMVISLFGVLTFFTILFAYYMPEKSPINLPPWLYPSRYHQVFNSPFVFARFDNTNQPTDVEIPGRVVIAAPSSSSGGRHGGGDGEELGTASASADSKGTTSFNNPMFDKNAIKQENPHEDGSLEQEMLEVELDEAK